MAKAEQEKGRACRRGEGLGVSRTGRGGRAPRARERERERGGGRWALGREGTGRGLKMRRIAFSGTRTSAGCVGSGRPTRQEPPMYMHVCVRQSYGATISRRLGSTR
jgi:hypothetical protein